MTSSGWKQKCSEEEVEGKASGGNNSQSGEEGYLLITYLLMEPVQILMR